MSTARHPYPSDVSDDEWALVAPYLALVNEQAWQRKYDLREVYNGLRWLVRTGAQWRMLPHDFPHWEAVYQQTQRWLRAGCCEAIAHHLHMVLRLAAGRTGQPSAVILDARTVQPTPESGAGRATTGISAGRGARSMWRSTRWGICWRRWHRRDGNGPYRGTGVGGPRLHGRGAGRAGCGAAGWWSAASPGWRAMMSACPKPWRG